jgi:hypothetical protein
MNERIMKLAKEVAAIEGWGPEVWQTTFTEKFAELLIRECAGICNDVGAAVWAEQHQSNIGTAQTCKAAIETHFGVE